MALALGPGAVGALWVIFRADGDLAKANGAHWQNVRYKMNSDLGDLVQIAAERKWPMPNSIFANQANLKTGTLDGTAREGFITAAKAFGFEIDDPAAFVERQQQSMFAWVPDAPDDLGLTETHETTDVAAGGPKFVQFFGPVLDALRTFGGSAEPRQVMDKGIDLADVTPDELNETNKNGQSKYENQVGWARFHLAKVKISMDGRGRWIDNRMIERLSRSLKYECVYLNAFETGTETRKGIGAWINYYNEKRPPPSHGLLTPAEVYDNQQPGLKLAA